MIDSILREQTYRWMIHLLSRPSLYYLRPGPGIQTPGVCFWSHLPPDNGWGLSSFTCDLPWEIYSRLGMKPHERFRNKEYPNAASAWDDLRETLVKITDASSGNGVVDYCRRVYEELTIRIPASIQAARAIREKF